MSVLEWIYEIVVEGAKYVIIGHWFFGYEFNKKKTRYLLALYPLLIPVIEVLMNYMGISYGIFWYKNTCGLIVISCVLQGKLFDKMKNFLLMWFIITMIDIIMLFPAIMFTTMEEQDIYMKMLFGCMGGVFWIIVAYKAKKLQKGFQSFIRKMSVIEYCLLVIILYLVSLALGGVQGYWYGGITHSKRDVVFAIDIIITIIVVIICVLLFYTRQSKAHLEEMNKANASYLALQHQYYQDSLTRYEDMRSLQHDINKHIYMISELCRENKIDDLKRYVDRMAESYEKVRAVHTGNFIADSIISYSLRTLQSEENFEFQLDGYFPEKFFMEDVDFCVLLSNLLDNAREALERVEGMRLIHMEIKRFQEKFYLVVSNSIADGEIDFSATSKSDKAHHGYGVQNIRRVVEKYNGTVQWKLEDGMAVVVVVFEEE